jgi:hypothetical protein
MEQHRDKQLQELRARIQRGQYVVDAGAVAEAIVQRLFDDGTAADPLPVRSIPGHRFSRARRLETYSRMETVAAVAS